MKQQASKNIYIMKLTKNQCEYIVKRFREMRTREDFLHLANYAKKIIYGEKAYDFKLNQLTYYSNPRVNPNRYRTFTVKKKSGGVRMIHAPTKGLMEIQKSLNLILNCVFNAHSSAFGFVPGKSIRDNAAVHAGNYYVYNIDLKDFFFSIDQARVWKCFQLAPFLLGKKTDTLNDEKGKNLEVVNMISALCCAEIETGMQQTDGTLNIVKKNVVPQGAPTSPIVTNIVCQRLDFLLAAAAKRFGLKYSRYADDITFSSLHNVYQTDSDFIAEIKRVIKEQGFQINSSKTRLQKMDERQTVTGLVVNKNVNVPRNYIKKMRSWLYLWERYGYEKTYSFFLNDYIRDKGHLKKRTPDMANVLRGKLEFLKIVKGTDDKVYQQLNNRYTVLIARNRKDSLNDRLLNYWELHGLHAAWEHFKAETGIMTIDKFLDKLLKETVTDDERKNKLLKLIQSSLNTSSLLTKSTSKFTIPDNEKLNMPKRVADFMSLFDDPAGLKYLTHDFDESDQIFDIESFLPQTRKVFEDKTKPGNLTIPSSLWKIVYEFAFSETPDWNKGCKDGWSLPDRIKWSIDSKKHLKRNEGFAATIESFRKLTRIEAPELKRLINQIVKEKLGDKYPECTIKLKDCEKADFYTHVAYFSEAIKLLLDGFNKRIGECKEIAITYTRKNDDPYRLRIITLEHVGSFPMKPLDDFFRDLGNGKGELADARNKLTGYCDWAIETIWDSKLVRITLLGAGNEIEYLPNTKEVSNRITGFTHILTFYQK
ncbi:hypothetical protein DDR33_24270 [Pararcticibacter amylolyticus]|uniref:RNA-directed DNA polymerase n=2 Tax=Pararcticibacter amylolyticus TaxID=2173175 RepID=A0A2U2P9I1_9SPHI|nr:hypothetical protein DDR33_24270 [Pararcticibacter amylolyticus]